MDVKNPHSVTKTEISVFGRQALDAERRRSPSLADKVLTTLFRFFTFASEYKIFVSSANNTNLRIFDTLHISLMYKMNNLGPSTEPCGTPHATPRVLDEEAHIFTNCFRSLK